MATKPEIPQEEVDLGTLFSQIGKMFSNFFAFIGNIFKSIYHYCIVFLLFLRKNIIVLGVATLIGIIVGYIFDSTAAENYSSEMDVETAYGSGKNLYKQIEYLNVLISKEDSTKIGDLFDVPSTEAARLSQFVVLPLNDNKYFHLAYDDFKQDNDTTYTRSINFKDFLNRITESDLKFYTIQGKSADAKVFPKLNENFEDFLVNDYYKGLRDKKLAELQFEKEKLVNSLSQIDSLRKRYKETAYLQFEEKDEENSGVSFRTINAGYRGNVDVDLYHQSDTLLLQLREVNQSIVENEEVVKIQSGFTLGTVKSSLLSQKWLRYGILGFLISFLVLVGIKFNGYLKEYENEVSQ